MKICPVCHSRCFDDMDMCYGCLYRFSGEVPPLCGDDGFDDISGEIAEPAFSPKAIDLPQMSPSPLANACDKQALNEAAAKDLGERPSMAAPESFSDKETMVMTIEIPASWVRVLTSTLMSKTF